MTVYLVNKSQPDYDCGSAWTDVVDNKGYKTCESAFNAMIADILKEMGLSSLDEVPDKNDYDACAKLRYNGINNWGIPKEYGDHINKTCDAYLKTCDSEITYDIQTLEIED